MAWSQQPVSDHTAKNFLNVEQDERGFVRIADKMQREPHCEIPFVIIF
jgi:hypothetical protein